MTLRRMLVKSVALAVMLAVMPASAASAAQPANRACLGIDASSFARTGLLGKFVSGTAKSAPMAIGAEVQLHLAGEIPDSVFLNTCND